MTAHELFCKELDTFAQFENRNNALLLYSACGHVWSDAAEMPFNSNPDVETILKNASEFDRWKKNGRTYAGAAHRIRPILKRDYLKDSKL